MKTLIIAEIGINHNGSTEIGQGIIDGAHEAGVQAVKFQTYRPDLRFEEGNPFISIFEQNHLPFEEEVKLWRYAAERGLKVLTTPFDKPSVEDCRTAPLDGVKIASFETTNLELVRSVATLKKPTYFSTGQNTMDEVKAVIAAIREQHDDITPMHCISSYPMKIEDANLSVISRMQDELRMPIGFSDHSEGHLAAGLAVAMGVTCIEKHFTIDNDLEGPDHAMSMTPKTMKTLVDHVALVETMMGDDWMGVRPCEEQIYKVARRETA